MLLQKKLNIQLNQLVDKYRKMDADRVLELIQESHNQPMAIFCAEYMMIILQVYGEVVQKRVNDNIAQLIEKKKDFIGALCNVDEGLDIDDGSFGQAAADEARQQMTMEASGKLLQMRQGSKCVATT